MKVSGLVGYRVANLTVGELRFKEPKECLSEEEEETARLEYSRFQFEGLSRLMVGIGHCRAIRFRDSAHRDSTGM